LATPKPFGARIGFGAGGHTVTGAGAGAELGEAPAARAFGSTASAAKDGMYGRLAAAPASSAVRLMKLRREDEFFIGGIFVDVTII
jgi:hypothetical protein